MDNQEITQLTFAITQLNDSVNGLHTIQQDILNDDASHDDISSLKGTMIELMQSNEELRKSIGYLNAAVNNLTDATKKR